jgi:hypothetical protein
VGPRYVGRRNHPCLADYKGCKISLVKIKIVFAGRSSPQEYPQDQSNQKEKRAAGSSVLKGRMFAIHRFVSIARIEDPITGSASRIISTGTVIVTPRVRTCIGRGSTIFVTFRVASCGGCHAQLADIVVIAILPSTAATTKPRRGSTTNTTGVGLLSTMSRRRHSQIADSVVRISSIHICIPSTSLPPRRRRRRNTTGIGEASMVPFSPAHATTGLLAVMASHDGFFKSLSPWHTLVPIYLS